MKIISSRRWRTALATLPLTCSFAAASPAIEIDALPNYGVDGYLRGSVSGIATGDYKVAPYIQIEGAGWWTKPTFDNPSVPIAANGTFVADVASGGLDNRATIFCVYLLAEDAEVPLAAGDAGLPGAIEVLAVAHACTERFARTFGFAGFEWGVKEAPLPVGPGGNRFSDRGEDVFVDEDGRLHLWLRYRDGVWWSSETILTESLGFGTYLFQTESDVDTLDPNVIFGAFTWDSYGDDTTVPGSVNREIDSEDGRWGNPADPAGSQWAVAPYWPQATVHRYALPDLGEPPHLTRFISWNADAIEFTALRGINTPCAYAAADVIDDYRYEHNPAAAQYVPSAGRERFRFNLWLIDPSGPVDGQAAEIVVSDFFFFPAGDSDCDGIAPELDNCSALANAVQRDTDGDGFGNRCDADLTNDCTVNFADLDIFRSLFFTADPDADLDGNGAVDFADLQIVRDGFFAPPGPSALAVCPGHAQ